MVEVQKPKENEVIQGRISFLDNAPSYVPLVAYLQRLENNAHSYVPLVPYLQRLEKEKLDKQFGKFLKAFKKLHIKIPFADALTQMASYMKFMKDILSNKCRLEEFETVELTEECNAILQKMLPLKLKDPRNFCIPYTIG